MVRQAGWSAAAHVKRLERSGLSVAEYSRRNGVSPWVLYAQRSRVRKVIADRGGEFSAVGGPGVTFAEVSLKRPVSPQGIRLVFPDGIEATLPCGFAASDLRNVIAELRADSGAGQPC